jgi:hypothetical protein
MEYKEHIVNLDLPPAVRWEFLKNHVGKINDLMQCYLDDFLGVEDEFIANLHKLKGQLVSKDYIEEIDFLAKITGYSPPAVLLQNLYYDAMKMYIGCASVAIETKDGNMLHARNLDWWSDNDILSRYTEVFDFQRNGKTVYKSVAWLGYFGVISGIKPNAFSVTINAASSHESFQIAKPVTYLLREVLDTCETYEEAKEMLINTKLMSDSILTLVGAKKGQKTIIERTPTKAKVLENSGEVLIATNHYLQIENLVIDGQKIQESSEARYQALEQNLDKKIPQNLEECMALIQQPDVAMEITAQHIAFDIKSGRIDFVRAHENRINSHLGKK